MQIQQIIIKEGITLKRIKDEVMEHGYKFW